MLNIGTIRKAQKRTLILSRTYELATQSKQAYKFPDCVQCYNMSFFKGSL